MSSSVSFRITRTAEDLAQTITTLSQRLVKLEQRQEALELQVRQQLQSVQQVPDEERATLDGIELLLQETRQLLELTDTQADDNGFGQEMAA
ncbi:MAG: chemotaxis protein [Synechococcus sp.]|tara:strand:- start:23 stop:298 length:276 start_codon:yes stop_codon:yes gene_type:complete